MINISTLHWRGLKADFKEPITSIFAIIIGITSINIICTSYFHKSIINLTFNDIVNLLLKSSPGILIIHIITILILYVFFYGIGIFINIIVENFISFCIAKYTGEYKYTSFYSLRELEEKLLIFEESITNNEKLKGIAFNEELRDFYLNECEKAREENKRFHKQQVLSRVAILFLITDLYLSGHQSIIGFIGHESYTLQSAFYTIFGIWTLIMLIIYGLNFNFHLEDASKVRLPFKINDLR